MLQRRIFLTAILMLIISGCAVKNKDLGYREDLKKSEIVYRDLQIRPVLSGENLCLKLSLRGDLPYEKVNLYEDKVYLGNTAFGLDTAFSQNDPVSGVLALTLVPIGMVIDIFGPRKVKREETIDDVVKTDCPIPIEDGTRLEGRLKISDIDTGMVFEERVVSLQVKNSEVELPLPRMNNGGTLKIELNGAMEIYKSQVPVEYVGKIEV